MSYVSGNYNTGAIYSFSKTGLADGSNYTYYFEAKDINNLSATNKYGSGPNVGNSSPSLSWTGETNYTSDGIHPEVGNPSTLFIYRIKYIDADSDTPASGYPKVHILKGGVEISGSPFTMSYVSGSYSSGAIYSYSTTLPVGTDYTYYFEAYDALNASATPTPQLDAPDVIARPSISLSTNSLNFSAIQGGSNPANQTFTITNSGVSGSTLTWTISDDATWLTLSPSSGSLNSGASATVTASVDISGLSTGIYNATITVSDPNATNSPQTISVTLIISANPILSVNVSTLDFGEVKRNESKTMSFRIANTGSGTLVGNISSDKAWIKVSPTNFEISAGDSKYIYVTVDNSILNQGDYREYTGNVNITSNGGNTTIIVKLTATCVRTKPNPYKISSDKPLVFWGSGVVPYNTTIRIYTLSGDLVKTLSETEGKNEIYWDGRAENGTKVAPGIYLYTSESPKEKTSGKFIVVK